MKISSEFLRKVDILLYVCFDIDVFYMNDSYVISITDKKKFLRMLGAL